MVLFNTKFLNYIIITKMTTFKTECRKTRYSNLEKINTKSEFEKAFKDTKFELDLLRKLLLDEITINHQIFDYARDILDQIPGNNIKKYILGLGNENVTFLFELHRKAYNFKFEELSKEIFEYIKPFLRKNKDFGNSKRDKKFKKNFKKVNKKIKDGKKLSNIDKTLHKINQTDRDYLCSYCLKRHENKLKCCKRCKDAHYCNRECQINDWEKHKKRCNYISNKKKD